MATQEWTERYLNPALDVLRASVTELIDSFDREEAQSDQHGVKATDQAKAKVRKAITGVMITQNFQPSQPSGYGCLYGAVKETRTLYKTLEEMVESKQELTAAHDDRLESQVMNLVEKICPGHPFLKRGTTSDDGVGKENGLQGKLASFNGHRPY
jgi:hypothetical protein